MRRRPRGRSILAIAALCVAAACRAEQNTPEQTFSWPAGEAAEIDKTIATGSTSGERDGLAAAIMIDVSGSMARAPRGADEPKIIAARRAALDIVDRFAKYAADHPTEPVMLGIYEFSSRDSREDTREVIAMGPPDRPRAAAAVAVMQPGGGTPIGDAMIAGKRALDTTGLTRRHLLVITDGENTDGHEPGAVAAAFGRRAEAERPSLYFVAFDITASRFADVKTAGGLVLEAVDSRGLTETLETLLTGQILLER